MRRLGLTPRKLVAIAIGVATLLVATATALGAISQGKFVFRDREVKDFGHAGAGGRHARVTCPTGDRILTGGGFWHKKGEGPTPDNALSSTRSSAPTADGRGWYADGGFLDSHRPGSEYRVTALCLPQAAVGVYTVETQELIPPASGRVGGRLRCPTGDRVVAGGAVWHEAGSNVKARRHDNTYVDGSAPVDQGTAWYASGYADQQASSNLRLREVAFCLPKTATGAYTVKAHNWLSRSADQSGHRVAGGHLSCPAGERVVTGGALWHRAGLGPNPRDTVYLSGSAPTRDDRWYADGTAYNSSQLLLREIVICVKPS